jgi:hypothetical protein
VVVSAHEVKELDEEAGIVIVQRGEGVMVDVKVGKRRVRTGTASQS